MYNKVEMKNKVENALTQYAVGEDNFNSGWNILRYIDWGYIIAESQNPYENLAAAKAGKLKVNEKVFDG